VDVAHRLSGIDFAWDRRKVEINLRKHRVAFEAACEIFFDPFVKFIGTDIVYGEARETAIGMTGDWKLLKVAYVFGPACVRLISARAATIQERQDYEEQ
jgi:hypothetical protein